VLYVLDRRGQPEQPAVTALPTLGLSALDVATGKTRWTFAAQITGLSPAVAVDLPNDQILIECWSGEDAAVCAVDAATGTERWRRSMPPGTSATGHRFGIVAIAAAEKAVYVAYGDGSVYALDAHLGGVQWRRPLGSGDATSDEPARIVRLAVAGDTVYATIEGVLAPQMQGDGLVAINSATGEERWTFRAPPVAELCSDWPMVSTVAANLQTVYVADLAGVLHALDADTGEQRWGFAPLRQPNSECPMSIANPSGIALGEAEALYVPVVVGDTVVFSPLGPGNILRDRHVTEMLSEHVLYGIDAATGTERWRAQLPGTLVGPPVVQESAVVSATRSEGSLVALDGATGRQVWRAGSVETAVGQPAVWSDRVYITTQTVKQVFLGYEYEDAAVVAYQVQSE
jgi:outer membrane protein assembly factor BamB